MKKNINIIIRYGRQRNVYDLLPTIGVMTKPFVLSLSWLGFYVEVER